MELRDLIVTPLLIIIVYIVAYVVRPYVTDGITRGYFIPALTLRIIGALALGFIYQFYYRGGDTFNYHTYGSRIIYEAFMDSPETGLRLLFTRGYDTNGIYQYTSRILFFGDPGSYTIVRISSIFDLFTFSTYSATAVLFGLFSFTGMWMFFLTFYHQYPHLHRGIAVASFFIPSAFFWGSGLLKDTITLGCLGMAVYSTFRIFILKRMSFRSVLLLLIALYGLYSIKIYILLTFLPAAILWVFMSNLDLIKSFVARVALFPFMIIVAVAIGYLAVIRTGKDDKRYAMSSLAKTAQITAYDIRYYTGKEAGSGYDIGELDGTLGSMFRLAPQAINVSLFRPYLWEVRNPLMLLSALESFVLLLVTLYCLFRSPILTFQSLKNPNVLFLIVFSIVFAFAVGVSTFNFGSLVRYKIPMMPFFVLSLILIFTNSRRQNSAMPANKKVM